MGSEDRDSYRDDSRRARSRDRRQLIAGVVVGALLFVAVSPPVSDRLGYTPPFGIANIFPGEREPAAIRYQLSPRTPGARLGAQSLYPPNDPWRAWLADEATCPGGEDSKAPVTAQLQVMRCLLNYARERQGLEPLAFSPLLNTSAASKARDIVRCSEFSHEACGKRSNQAAVDVGHRGSFGENLYVAEGKWTAPRPALARWLNSEGHRENVFDPTWRWVGISRLGGAEIGPIRPGVVWVNHFGD